MKIKIKFKNVDSLKNGLLYYSTLKQARIKMPFLFDYYYYVFPSEVNGRSVSPGK